MSSVFPKGKGFQGVVKRHNYPVVRNLTGRCSIATGIDGRQFVSIASLERRPSLGTWGMKRVTAQRLKVLKPDQMKICCCPRSNPGAEMG